MVGWVVGGGWEGEAGAMENGIGAGRAGAELVVVKSWGGGGGEDVDACMLKENGGSSSSKADAKASSLELEALG